MNRKQQVIEYLKSHLNEWTHNQQLRDLTSLNDVPRTIRLLRQEGWQIEVRGDGYVRLTSKEKGAARGERKGISQRVRYQVLSESGFRCQACGASVEEDHVKLVADHKVPVDWGGTNDITNLQALCEECNRGKQAWIADHSSEAMKEIMSKPSVEQRIEALFDMYPNQDIPSETVRMVSKEAFDWQRALRRIRQRTGKKIDPLKGRNAYRYTKD